MLREDCLVAWRSGEGSTSSDGSGRQRLSKEQEIDDAGVPQIKSGEK